MDRVTAHSLSFEENGSNSKAETILRKSDYWSKVSIQLDFRLPCPVGARAPIGLVTLVSIPVPPETSSMPLDLPSGSGTVASIAATKLTTTAVARTGNLIENGLEPGSLDLGHASLAEGPGRNAVGRLDVPDVGSSVDIMAAISPALMADTARLFDDVLAIAVSNRDIDRSSDRSGVLVVHSIQVHGRNFTTGSMVLVENGDPVRTRVTRTLPEKTGHNLGIRVAAVLCTLRERNLAVDRLHWRREIQTAVIRERRSKRVWLNCIAQVDTITFRLLVILVGVVERDDSQTVDLVISRLGVAANLMLSSPEPSIDTKRVGGNMLTVDEAGRRDSGHKAQQHGRCSQKAEREHGSERREG
jgi:hypothetical protein